MRDKLIDGLFNGRKSINLVVDGLSTCKKSISPWFGLRTLDLDWGLGTEDLGLRTVVVVLIFR